MDTTNEFRAWIDQKTAGFSRSNKKKYKQDFSQLMGIPFSTVERWYGGTTFPQRIQKIAVNTETRESVFVIEEL